MIAHLPSRSPLAAHESFYVAISRGRYGAKVFTSDVSILPESLARSIPVPHTLHELGPLETADAPRVVGADEVWLALQIYSSAGSGGNRGKLRSRR